MSQRETRLVLGVALVLVLAGGWYVWSSYSTAAQSKKREIANLTEQIHTEEETEFRAQMALARLERYREHALSENKRDSQAFYQERLRQQVESAGLRNVIIKPRDGKRGGKYQEHYFDVNASGNLLEVIQFAYEFYSYELVHKISSFTFTPRRESNELDVKLMVAVLGIDGVQQLPKLEQVHRDTLPHGTLEDYAQVIGNRDFFGPANQAPVFTIQASHEVELGRTFSYRLTAKDPDKGDTVKFKVGDDAPEGVVVSESGTLAWRPEKLGEYQIPVVVQDSRNPPKADEKVVTLRVLEPRERSAPEIVREPTFDDAKYTFLTATIEVGGEPQVWLNNRPKDQRIMLGVGDSFTIGSVKGTILMVRDRKIEIDVNGQRRSLDIGRALTETQVIDTASIQVDEL